MEKVRAQFCECEHSDHFHDDDHLIHTLILEGDKHCYGFGAGNELYTQSTPDGKFRVCEACRNSHWKLPDVNDLELRDNWDDEDLWK